MHTSSVGSRLNKFHRTNGIKPHARGQRPSVASATPPSQGFHDPLTESGRRLPVLPGGHREFVGGLGLIVAAAIVGWLAWVAFSGAAQGLRPIPQDSRAQAVSR